jgi:hypothetical protein
VQLLGLMFIQLYLNNENWIREISNNCNKNFSSPASILRQRSIRAVTAAIKVCGADHLSVLRVSRTNHEVTRDK